MAAPKMPAHGAQLPHSKFTSRQAWECRARIESKRQKLAQLRDQRDRINAEINELIKTDTRKQLAEEYGVSETTIDRIGRYETYWRLV